MASPLSIRLLGVFEVRVNSRPLPRLRFYKSRAVLALLVLRHGSELERGWLAGLLWPDSGQEEALHNLRNCLTALRDALGPEAGRLLSPRPRTLALDLTGASVDVLAFDAAMAHGDPAALEEAVALYRGPLLEGCTEEWLFQERQVREQTYLAARETLAAHALAHGDPGGAERHLRAALATDPLREQTQRALMELLAANGNYAAALVAYRELRQRLHREANAEPDPETRALFERLRAEAREKSAAGRSARHLPPARISTPANGKAPHSRMTSAVLSFAPLHADGDSTAAYRQPPSEASRSTDALFPNLPLQLTSFVGREAEMAEIRQQLDAHRLVTLTGAGGSGKTRLALEVATGQRAAYPDGAWFVDLAPLGDATLVSQTVAAVLGIREQPDRPLLQTLLEALKQKRLLLVLDNCEHLATACAQLAETALQSCGHLQLLATSREPLGIAGEWTHRVPPLSLPAVVDGQWLRVPTTPSGPSTLNPQPSTNQRPSVSSSSGRQQCSRPSR